jgi:hypothetical protein
MENKLSRRKLYTKKRMLSSLLYLAPITLSILWKVYNPEPIWAFHIQSWGISWQVVCTFLSFMLMPVWALLDKRGVWDEK